MIDRTVRATLIGDGTSDRVLVHVLRWIFAELRRPSEIHHANLGMFSVVPSGLRDRALTALKFFPATNTPERSFANILSAPVQNSMKRCARIFAATV